MLFKLYTAVVRPYLDYACWVWNPHLLKDKEGLERVETLALRLCIKQWDIAYVDLLLHFSPADRRDYLSLCIMYKIIQSLSHLLCYELPTTYSMFNLLLVQIHFKKTHMIVLMTD